MKHQLVLRDTQPHRFEAYERGQLSALDVMRDNMEFFHHRAAELLATIMAMPLSEEAPSARPPRLLRRLEGSADPAHKPTASCVALVRCQPLLRRMHH